MITDFIFDGQNLSGFGYIICDFDGSNGTEIHTVSEKSFTTIKSPLSNKSHVVAVSEENDLNRTIQIMKNTCNNDSLDITNDDLSELSRWLCRNDYKLFKWVDDKDDDEIFYEVQIKLRKIELSGGRVGAELDITANTPHGFTKEFNIDYSVSGQNVAFVTYECVKDIYSEGSWQDMVLSLVYSCGNSRVDFYSYGLNNMPFFIGDYQYYALYKKGNYLMFLGFNPTTDIYIVASCGLTYDPSTDNRLESLTSTYDSFIEDEKYNDSTVSNSGTNIFFKGTYSRWDINCSGQTNEWTCSQLDKTLETRYLSCSQYSLLDTNIPLYAEYEFYEKVSRPEYINNGNKLSTTNMYVDEFSEYTSSLTVLNDNVSKTYIDDNDKKIEINVFSDDEGYIYPNVTITIKQNGNLELVNEYENRTTYIADCKNGEIITIIGGDTLQITSSDDTHDMSSCFNYKFPRLCTEYGNYINTFCFSINCDIEMKYKGIRKVGI